MLCQLSYTHHCREAGPPASAEMSIAVPVSAQKLRYFSGGVLPYRAAISRAVAESGPGCGTNSASR